MFSGGNEEGFSTLSCKGSFAPEVGVLIQFISLSESFSEVSSDNLHEEPAILYKIAWGENLRLCRLIKGQKMDFISSQQLTQQNLILRSMSRCIDSENGMNGCL